MRFLVCVFAFCAFCAPAALADPPDVSVTLSGVIERTHLDTTSGPVPVTVLSTASGPQAVTFAADQPVLPNGAEVGLHGRLEGSTLVASSAQTTGPTVAVPSDGGQQGTPLASGTPRSVAIVVISFTGGPATPTYTDAQLQGVLVSNPNSVSNYFNEQSYGAVAFRGINDVNGDVFRVTIAANGSGCAWQTWGSQAAAAVGASTIAHYDHAIYVFNSGHTCGFAGLAYMPGNEVYIDNAFQLSVVAHELGHNLGVHHAASLRCSSAGQTVSFSSANNACVPNEYGDPFDIMGSSGTNQQNAFHKWQSGWLGASNGPRVQTISASGDYAVAPLEASSGVALLLVPHITAGTVSDPNTTLGTTFALDFRQPYGSYFDAYQSGSSVVGGVQIRLVQAPGSGYPIQTQLIDATPSTPSFGDATLVKDATFTDTTDGITIQTVDVNPLGATVRVTYGSSGGGGGTSGGGGGGTTVIPPDTTPPTAVANLTATVASGPVVSLAFAPAADDRAVSSYRITRDGVQLDFLGAGGTTYADASVSYGTHVYGIAAVDTSGNVGPAASVTAIVSPPVPPPVSPTPTVTPPTSRRPAVTRKLRVTVKIIGTTHARRALLSWPKAPGATRYVVIRNGKTLRATAARTLVDANPPRGRLSYRVTVRS